MYTESFELLPCSERSRDKKKKKTVCITVYSSSITCIDTGFSHLVKCVVSSISYADSSGDQIHKAALQVKCVTFPAAWFFWCDSSDRSISEFLECFADERRKNVPFLKNSEVSLRPRDDDHTGWWRLAKRNQLWREKKLPHS